MKYENDTFPEAIKILADRAGVKLPEVEETPEQKKKAGSYGTEHGPTEQSSGWDRMLQRSDRCPGHGRTGTSGLKDPGRCCSDRL